jgi:large subunit ribosomal protein L5
MADEKKQKQAQPGGSKPKGERKGKGGDSAALQTESGRPKASSRGTARLREKYAKEIAPALAKEFNLTNTMAVPKLEKVVINMGVGEATQNAKLIDPAVNELSAITGQKAVVTRAKKSIAAFKVREGMPIGAMVTLRGDRMYEFLDRLINIALPRVRDFRGVNGKSFDGRGNYTLGLRDQLIFPEIDYAKVEKTKGMNITFVTTARNDEQARALLRQMGIPFRQAGS